MRSCRPTAVLIGLPLVKLPPDTNKRGREFLRGFFDPLADPLDRKPAARFDFLRMQAERPFTDATVNPHELFAGFGARFDAEDLLWHGLQFDAEFLFHLP